MIFQENTLKVGCQPSEINIFGILNLISKTLKLWHDLNGYELKNYYHNNSKVVV